MVLRESVLQKQDEIDESKHEMDYQVSALLRRLGEVAQQIRRQV